MYLAERLTGQVGSVSRIARGIPVGGDLEYADEVTLVRAMQGRHELAVAPSAMRYLVNEALLRLIKPAAALVLGALLYWVLTGPVGDPGRRHAGAGLLDQRGGPHPAGRDRHHLRARRGSGPIPSAVLSFGSPAYPGRA